MFYNYVLNLDRRTDRWELIKKKFEKINLIPNRFSAIDGSDPIFKEKNKNSTIQPLSALACLQSHINIILDAKKNNYKKIMVFEDDVIFKKDFNLNDLTPFLKYKLIYLGATQINWEGIEISEGYYHPNNTLGTWAMIIDSSIYDRILNTYKNNSADLCLKEEFKNDKEACVLYPNWCICDVSSSDIKSKGDPNKFYNKCRWNLSNYDGNLVE